MSTAQRYRGRRGALAARLAERHGPDTALVVTSAPNIAYLTGFTGSSGVLVAAAADSVLLTDFRYLEQAAQQCPGLAVRETRRALPDAFATAGRAAAAVAVEIDHLTAGQYLSLLTTGPRPIAARGLVEGLRAVKDPTEIDLVSRACSIAQDALLAVAEAVRPGMTERRIAADLEYQMALRGAQAPAFESIVAGGPNSSIPHHGPTGRAVAAGELLKIDFGARLDGYHSDITRTFVVGAAPSDWQAHLHDVVARAQAAGLAQVRAGGSVADLDGAARGVIADAGLADRFGHGIGHGVGLQIHEHPLMAPGSAGTLEEGMVITVEPGVYLPGRGGVRIEDTVVVTAHGYRSLTDLPRELRRLA